MSETTEKKPFALVRMARGIGKWLREMRSELKKVVWPTPKQLIHNSAIVFTMIIVISTFIAILDWCIASLVNTTISAFTGITRG